LRSESPNWFGYNSELEGLCLSRKGSSLSASTSGNHSLSFLLSCRVPQFFSFYVFSCVLILIIEGVVVYLLFVLSFIASVGISLLHDWCVEAVRDLILRMAFFFYDLKWYF
jgi:hypothetical protein